MRIGFVSMMAGSPWGGSEELWSRAAMVLLARGHEVAMSCRRWPTIVPQLGRLIDAGALPHFRSRAWLGRSLRRVLERFQLVHLRFMRWIQKTRPDFIVISFANHCDDPQVANMCHLLGVPYAIVVQAAGPHLWIASRSLADFRSAYMHARRCFFVSGENRQVLESNLAVDLPHAEIVDNPFNVDLDAAPTWPATEPAWKLACVARINFLSKSQDLLVRVLRQPKWRARPLRVSLYGPDDGFLSRLGQLVELHNLREQLSYAGVADDMAKLWSEHHGLLLPSRVEGNALSLIEAMICGRVPITTKVGRADELIDDNQCGFLAAAATAELIDEVLERAWQRRHDWQRMGQLAAIAIRQRHSLRPAEDFADRILDAASSPKTFCKAAA
jgi:glycosyltransferase involved in cell wall biosynthesis